MTDKADRTLAFSVRCTGTGGRELFKLLADWIDAVPAKFRHIDMFEQRVDGVDMEIDDDNTKELSKTSGDSYGGSA